MSGDGSRPGSTAFAEYLQQKKKIGKDENASPRPPQIPARSSRPATPRRPEISFAERVSKQVTQGGRPHRPSTAGGSVTPRGGGHTPRPGSAAASPRRLIHPGGGPDPYAVVQGGGTAVRGGGRGGTHMELALAAQSLATAAQQLAAAGGPRSGGSGCSTPMSESQSVFLTLDRAAKAISGAAMAAAAERPPLSARSVGSMGSGRSVGGAGYVSRVRPPTGGRALAPSTPPRAGGETLRTATPRRPPSSSRSLASSWGGSVRGGGAGGGAGSIGGRSQTLDVDKERRDIRASQGYVTSMEEADRLIAGDGAGVGGRRDAEGGAPSDFHYPRAATDHAANPAWAEAGAPEQEVGVDQEKFMSGAYKHSYNQIYHLTNPPHGGEEWGEARRPYTGESFKEQNLFRPPKATLSSWDKYRMLYHHPESPACGDQGEFLKANFNQCVALLKDKIYTKGAFSITQHFQTLDADASGVLDKNEFYNALEKFNLGPCMNDQVAEMFLNIVDRDRSGGVDYLEFTEALRMGRVPYLPVMGKKRVGPDPELPFGDPRHRVPFAIMHDADRNLQKFDKKINGLYKSLEDTFHKFDEDGSGQIDRREFHRAMRLMNQRQNLNLSDGEIALLFKDADKDHSGEISWEEFVKSFAGGAGKRFIPEFLKPKSMRRSQPGNPWDWPMESDFDPYRRQVHSYPNVETPFSRGRSPARPLSRNPHGL